MSLTQVGGTLVSSRCGQCGGSVRPDAPWCTLCLTPTRPVSAPEPEPEPEQAAGPAAEIDPLTAPLGLLLDASAPGAPAVTARARHAASPTWPCATCSSENALDLTTCGTCGAGFLAAVVRDEPPLLVLPLVGDVTQWSKLHWLAAGMVLLVVCVMVIVTVGALLG